MQCPRCLRKLTESDWLLCSVPNAHYCPHCWVELTSNGGLLHTVGNISGEEGQQPSLTNPAEKTPR